MIEILYLWICIFVCLLNGDICSVFIFRWVILCFWSIWYWYLFVFWNVLFKFFGNVENGVWVIWFKFGGYRWVGVCIWGISDIFNIWFIFFFFLGNIFCMIFLRYIFRMCGNFGCGLLYRILILEVDIFL